MYPRLDAAYVVYKMESELCTCDCFFVLSLSCPIQEIIFTLYVYSSHRYKCPKCRLPYCSVKCCKDHKEICPAVIKVDKEKETACVHENNTNSLTSSTEASQYVPPDALNSNPIETAIKRRSMLDDNDTDDDSIEEHGWKISKEMMERLHRSAWLRNELSDGGLRQMIATIDNADWDQREETKKRKRYQNTNQIDELDPREAALERAKFTNHKFAKFVDKLLLTAGVLEENKNIDDDINNLLDGDIGPRNLILTSIPCKRKLKLPKEEEVDSGSDADSS